MYTLESSNTHSSKYNDIEKEIQSGLSLIQKDVRLSYTSLVQLSHIRKINTKQEWGFCREDLRVDFENTNGPEMSTVRGLWLKTKGSWYSHILGYDSKNDRTFKKR